jgi:uncharacterized cupin superfamily protein
MQQRRRSSKITNPMTPIGPVPFVGRQSELAEIKQHLAVVPLVSLHGALGSGKTRLVTELAPSLGAVCTVIECHPGDRASALRARAERALRCVPGTLAQTLTAQARVLVIDDIQHLRIDEATNLLSPLLLGPTALGRVIVVGRDPLSAAVGASIAEIELHGLDVDSASALWASMEEQYGALEAEGAFDTAYGRTRGVPLALRREYARARFGQQAWDFPALDEPARIALEALAILRQPVAPAAVSALAPGVDTEAALTSLVARQLVDAVGDGRIVVHEVVRVDVLSQVSADERKRLSAAAAELVASTAAVSKGPRLAWQAGDDGAFGAMDQITRVREVVWHWLAAGQRERAADVLLAHRELAARSGGAGEFEALLEAVSDRPRRRAGTISDVVPEAPLDQTEHGLEPAGPGWFVLNAREAAWRHAPGRSAICLFEGDGEAEFDQLGINVGVLEPGQIMAMYHWEADQVDFLVLSGEAVAIVEGEERRLRAWDLLQCPAGARHTIVGAGDGPCIVVAVGARPVDRPGVGRVRAERRRRPARRERRAGDGRARRGVRRPRAARAGSLPRRLAARIGDGEAEDRLGGLERGSTSSQVRHVSRKPCRQTSGGPEPPRCRGVKIDDRARTVSRRRRPARARRRRSSSSSASPP